MAATLVGAAEGAQVVDCNAPLISPEPLTHAHSNSSSGSGDAGSVPVEIIHIQDLGYNWKTFDRYSLIPYEQRPYRSMLFLSDGGVSEDLLQTKRPDQLVAVTDYTEDTLGKINVRVDNNALPFKNGSFGFIFMNRGLCVCRACDALRMCGGIGRFMATMKNFLEEVIRVFNASDPDGLVVLTGYYFRADAASVPGLWRRAAQEIQAAHPGLEIKILSDNSLPNIDKGFMGLVIRGRASPLSIEEKLKVLFGPP
jgi:hypothetical protein